MAAKRKSAGKVATVAYEEPADNYDARVRNRLRKMGAADPEELVAVNSAYVARARDAEIDPSIVANTLFTIQLEQSHGGLLQRERGAADRRDGLQPGQLVPVDTPEQPRALRVGDRAWGAEERPSRVGYYAVMPSGKIVAGPFGSRHEADAHARRFHGYVQYEAGDALIESGAADCAPAKRPAEAVAVVAVTAGEPCGGCSAGGACEKLEPYDRPLRWHRDPKNDQQYLYADAGHLGRFVVARRKPDRRHGILEWSLHLAGREINAPRGKMRGFERAGDAQGRAERFARKPERAVAEPTAADPPPAAADCVAIVERTPGCAVPGRVVATPQDVYELVGARYEKLGHEVFEILLLNINDEVIGSPVQVASGQRSGVRVDVEQCLGPVVKGAEAGAVSWVALHNHPSGYARGSSKDDDLTKRLRAGSAVACPATKFVDHYVVGGGAVWSCFKKRVVFRTKRR